MKNVFLGSLITVVSVLLIIKGISYYQDVKTLRYEVWDAIPEDASLVFRLKDIQPDFKKLQKTALWNSLLPISSVHRLNENISDLDSIINKFSDLEEIVHSNSVYVSWHTNGNKDFDFLYSMSIPMVNAEKNLESLVNSILKDRVPITKRTYEGVTMVEMPITGRNLRNSVFTYCVYNGIFLGSFKSQLVEKAVLQLKRDPNKIKREDSFSRIVNAAGKQVDGNIFVNYKNLQHLIPVYFQTENTIGLKDIGSFAKWSVFDFKIQDNAYSFNGLTTLDSSGNSYLKIFEGQAPQAINLTSILPRNTALLVFNGTSDYRSYFANYNAYLSGSSKNQVLYKNVLFRQAALKKLDAQYNVSIAHKMLDWVGNESAFVSLEPSDTTYGDNSYGVFKTINSSLSKSFLKDLSEASGVTDSIMHQDFEIRQIKIPGLMPLLLGPSYKDLQSLFYTHMGEYVVFGNSLKSIRNFINENSFQHVLSREENFHALQNAMSSKCNMFVYLNIQSSADLLHDWGNDSLKRMLDRNIEALSSIHSIAFQYSYNDKIKGFYNTLYIQPKENKQKEELNKQVWSLALDSTISMAPQFVVNYQTGEKEVIVQDDGNKLYLINKEGEILWSKQLPGKILGKIYQVDAFRNDRLQFMFNTRLGLHLIDHEGAIVKDFPVKFSSPATTGISVFDYDHNREYRIFVPCADNVIHAYQVTGKPLDGWQFTRPIGAVRTPVQYFKINGKDYLIVNDRRGAVFMLDRKGESKIVGDKPLVTSTNNSWSLDMADQPYLVNTDTTGNIYNLYLKGTMEVEHISNFTPSHYFDYEDINGDKLKDYIFLDKNTVKALNQDTSKIFSYTFQNESSGLRLLFNRIDDNPAIGVVSTKNELVYLLRPDGSMYKGFPLKGNTSYEIGNLYKPNGSGKKAKDYLLVAGRKKMVYLYAL